MDTDTDNGSASHTQPIIYTTPWCGYCARLKAQLTRAGVAFTEVNIESDPAAADIVASHNGGDHLVPTVVMPDGTALSNPSTKQVQKALTGN